MKGTLTDEERDRMMRAANDQDDRNRGHAWWLRATMLKRRRMLRAAVHSALHPVH